MRNVISHLSKVKNGQSVESAGIRHHSRRDSENELMEAEIEYDWKQTNKQTNSRNLSCCDVVCFRKGI